MTSYVRTIKGTAYTVTAIENGKLVVRQPSGKKRLLTVKEVGRARYEAVIQHFFAQQREAAKAAKKEEAAA